MYSNNFNSNSSPLSFSEVRRPVWTECDNKSDLVFQMVDIGYNIGFHPQNSQNEEEYRHSRAVIRMFGVTQAGHSILCHVTEFEPYFFVSAWKGFEDESEDDQLQMIDALQRSMEMRMMREQSKGKKCDIYVERVIAVKKKSVWGYHSGHNDTFFQIFMSLPTLIPSARRMMISEDGFTVDGVGHFYFDTYESKLPFILRFMIDSEIVGAGWIHIPSGSYTMISTAHQSSFCSLEIVTQSKNVSEANINYISQELLCCGSAPLRVLSFDIECDCAQGFPEAKRSGDKILQISSVLFRLGDDLPFFQSVFCLDTCAPIAGVHIFTFDDEQSMLKAWMIFVQVSDADILTGYNIVNFDIPYMLDRSQYLGCYNSFSYLGRIKNIKTTMRDSQFTSRAYGSRKSKDISILGRVQLDLLPIIRRDHKLRSYSLNSVSFHFLRQQKEEVAYNMISVLHNGPNADAESRRRLAVYCLKDSMLPLRLMQKLMIAINLIEMARVTGVPINFLITRGQQIKVLSQLYRKARQHGLLIPSRERMQNDNSSFDGATVIEPMRGYYQTPVVTLDFASLYPSIMIAHNLCYTTLITDMNILNELTIDQYTKTDTNNYFVKSSVQKGLLPEILDELLTARRQAKKEMKSEKNASRKAVLNGRQLALKISANSVYGFTGATVGSLPCLSISASVTAFGRQMIYETKSVIESHYRIENGYEYNSTVIYGDTDSVMIRFGTTSVHNAMALGKEAAMMVSAKFVHPIKLEYEKIYLPYLLMNKKRYAGMLWSTADHYDYMDAKGIETVRRDNCELVKLVIQQVLNHILIDCDVNRAIEYTKGIIHQLVQNKMDMSLLVISKALGKFEEYKVKMAHVELAKRMQKRDPVNAPKTGDRVAYVITKGRKKARAYEKAEDPLFALEHNIALDTEYYLENQLKKPLMRIFSPVLGDNNKRLNDLFYGNHTRHIKVARPTIGSMMKWTVVRKTCIGCKCAMNNKKGNICEHCKPKESLLYLSHLSIVQKNERLFHELWAECQRCQGSLTQAVLCSNRDCPIFYRRTKCKKDLQESKLKLCKFNDLE